MKKISVLSFAVLLTMPAIAVDNVHKMYDKEPEPNVPEEIVEQYEQQFKKVEDKQIKEIPQVQEEEPQQIKEVEKVKEIKKIEKVEEPKETEKQKIEEPSNPKARFPHGLQLGIGVSPTSGLNGFIGYNNKNFNSFWAKRFGIRFDFATYSPIKSKLNKRINDYIGEDGVEIEDALKIDNFKLDAKHYGVLIDFYPFGNTWFLGGWRVSGGYFTGKLDLDADVHGKYDGSKIEFELDGKKYSYDGREMHAKAMADWKFSGPYLGTGFDLGMFWGFKVYMDAGIVFTDKTAKFDLDIPFQGLKDAAGNDITPDSSNPIIQAAYQEFNNAKEATLEDVRKEVKDYPYYPLVKLGLMYRF